MKYPQQDKVIERLENQTQRELKKMRNDARQSIADLWESTKNILRTGIRELYRRDFPIDPWNLPMAGRKRTIDKMSDFTSRYLSYFHEDSLKENIKNFREIYRESALRHAYMLDMVTPESYQIKLPRNRMFTEAAITTYQGPESDSQWKLRWSSWIDAYQKTLISNLRMGALNSSDMNNAEGEVDATKAGTPAYYLSDVFDRIIQYQTVALQAQSINDLVDINDDIDMEKIWQTSFSARVCDICDAQLGLTEDRVDTDIPAHPNCECYWRLVPASWAELLRNGDADEVATARWMDAKGLVPSSMVIRNEDGDIAGKVIVTFQDWVAGQSKVVGAR